MFLADIDIRKAVNDGNITISDFDESRLQPASYDLLLGKKFLIVQGNSTVFIDPVNKILPNYHEVILEDGDEFVLHPGATVLGLTKDFFGSNEYLIQLSGKSSLARIGLVVHNTAGIVSPGHFLHMTLELVNLNKVPIIIRPGMEIAQLLFSNISSPPEKLYDKTGRYMNHNWTGYVGKN